MLRRSVALLALAAAAACFSDKGVDLSGTGDPPDPSTSQAPGSTGTTSTTPSTGTTAEPTSTSTTTATSSETSTGEPACGDSPQCDPGALRDGAPCGICSVTREVCGEDCTWGPAACVETDACGYWQYSEQAGWQVLYPQPSDHAPKGPAVAAFDLTDEGRVVVLTAGNYHVLSQEGAWIDSGDVTTLFPLTKSPVLHAFTAPADGDFYYVTVIAGEFAQTYVIYPDTLKAEPFNEAPCCNSWTDRFSPPSLEAVRDVYVDLDNTPAWAFLDPNFLCGIDAQGPVPYAAWITADTVYVQDGYCDQMAYAVPYAQFPPFAAPGAPPGAQVGGVTQIFERLYVFPGE